MHQRDGRPATRLLERTMSLPMLRCSYLGDRRGYLKTLAQIL